VNSELFRVVAVITVKLLKIVTTSVYSTTEIFKYKLAPQKTIIYQGVFTAYCKP
jgi:hypothetical protein